MNTETKDSDFIKEDIGLNNRKYVVKSNIKIEEVQNNLKILINKTKLPFYKNGDDVVFQCACLLSIVMIVVFSIILFFVNVMDALAFSVVAVLTIIIVTIQLYHDIDKYNTKELLKRIEEMDSLSQMSDILTDIYKMKSKTYDSKHCPLSNILQILINIKIFTKLATHKIIDYNKNANTFTVEHKNGDIERIQLSEPVIENIKTNCITIELTKEFELKMIIPYESEE